MIMDGLETLSQVALEEQAQLSFDSFQPSSSTDPATMTSMEALVDDNLNTPVSAASDMFAYTPDTYVDPVPITASAAGKYLSADLTTVYYTLGPRGDYTSTG